MSKLFYRIFFLILVFLSFQNITWAISSEYKNSLEKIELQRLGNDTYTINLYMQKNYSSPTNVIKKNDLSYYILLPETKISSVKTGYKTAEIKSIDTNVYSYAGVDVNNGYTKINISTTKPINFKLNIKTSSPDKVLNKAPVIAQNKQEELIKKTEEENLAKNIPATENIKI